MATNFIIWLSLSQMAEPERFASLLKEAEERVAKDLRTLGDSRPGLREQYELQLQKLRGDQAPNVEIAIGPGFFPTLTGERVSRGPTLCLLIS